ncbi:MAG TPA: alkaline phosphatase family protein [Thermoanaerobaculia bacterium]|nr:alkaline phosphatase family protein [Thermoanaerobaculia bacterium]
MLFTPPKSSRAAAALLAVSLFSLPAAAAPRGKVVVLGFDGVDHALVARMVAEGKLPNLAALAEQGSFDRLRPTIPAQTPVSWSTFTTGLSPGRTLIFDFLKRNPKTYRPEFAIAEEGRKPFLFGAANRPVLAAAAARPVLLFGLLAVRLFAGGSRAALGAVAVLAALGAVGGLRLAGFLPETAPTVTNNRRGVPFWEAAGRHGIRSVVMHVPVTFPAVDYDHGRLVSGLGVPDVRGRIGTPSFYTSDPFFAPKNKNEFSVELLRLESNTGTIRTEVFGPYNKLFKEPPVIKIPMTLTVEGNGTALRIEPKGSEPVTLKVGEWSGWVVFTFPFNPVVKVSGIGRFHLASLSPEIQLYLSPVHFNPDDLPPAVKITAPAALAKKLAKTYGLYKTMGWQIDTWSMSEETLDEASFLEDVDFTQVQFRKMMEGFLAEKDLDLFVQIYEFPDRVAHCFWRFLDPKHPAYDAAKAARWAPAIETTYRQMDEIVGAARKRLGPDDLLLVVSDHGFSTWRRSVNYNTWLVQNGFMALTGGEGKQADLEQLFGQGEFWPNVDWSRTKAYSMGLGDIYVNLKGREGKGIVAAGAEYEAVRRQITEGLSKLVDPETGETAVSRIFTREEAYGAFDADIIPDLIVSNSRGYRVSWQSSLGVVTPGIFEDNNQVWSGDHCSLDPEVVPGIFFSSRKIDPGRKPAIADVPATILKALGVPAPEKLDGAPLF